MLRKLSALTLGALVLVLMGAFPASAHLFWLNAQTSQDGQVQAEIGYGHDFPHAESIPKERAHIFSPLQIVTPHGKQEMQQKGENYAYIFPEKMTKGDYLVIGTYKPTYWSKGEGGWKMQNRKERPEAELCGLYAMYAKTILSVDGATTHELISKPAGQPLEIVPLKNPATIQEGGVLPVQVLLHGKPLKMATVTGTFAGFSKDGEHKAFSGKTGLKGCIDVVLLRKGTWFLATEHEQKPKDPALCDEEVLESTLTFTLK